MTQAVLELDWVVFMPRRRILAQDLAVRSAPAPGRHVMRYGPFMNFKFHRLNTCRGQPRSDTVSSGTTACCMLGGAGEGYQPLCELARLLHGEGFKMV